MHLPKKHLFVLLFIFLYFILTRQIFATETFKEEFNGLYSEDVRWTRFENQGKLEFSLDTLKLLPASDVNQTPNSFPYLYISQNIFPSFLEICNYLQGKLNLKKEKKFGKLQIWFSQHLNALQTI